MRTFNSPTNTAPPPAGSGVCYFSLEYQGLYLTQSVISGGSDISYNEVAIDADSIPIWGHCHKRRGSNIILFDS